MMFTLKNKYSVLSILFVVVFLFSCSTSNEVVSNKLFQKRKYKKGWHKNSSPNYAHKSKKHNKKFVTKVTKNNVKDKHKVISKTSNNEIVSKEVESNSSVSKESVVTIQEIFSKNKFSQTQNENSQNNPELTPEVYKNYDKQPISRDVLESPTVAADDSDLRILLAILGIIMMIFTTIAPLGVLIALGRGEALRINLFIYLGAVILAIVGIILLIALGFESIIVGIVLTASIITWLISIIHAFVVIIRGY